MAEEVTLERPPIVEFAPLATKEAPERASRSSTDLFAPPTDGAFSPEMDVAQRLIVLRLTGLADDLTWASY
jgi:hypothetical protein